MIYTNSDNLFQKISSIIKKKYPLGLYVNYIFRSVKIFMEWVQIV